MFTQYGGATAADDSIDDESLSQAPPPVRLNRKYLTYPTSSIYLSRSHNARQGLCMISIVFRLPKEYKLIVVW